MGAGVRDAFPPPMCVGEDIEKQCDEAMAYRVVWWGVVGAVPVCPPVSPHKGASIVKNPAHHACILVWKRRCADVRAGT